MFTGIIEGLGILKATRPVKQGLRLVISTDIPLAETSIGDSIAVNGACLTAVEIGKNHFSADVSPETLAKTTLGKAKIGDRLNLERALRLADRLDGHLVSGHVDGIGMLMEKRQVGNYLILNFSVPGDLAHYMVPKGSVAVDGISLTINQCREDGFEVSIIPHTAGLTTLRFRRKGDPVNIETDIIGKYVEKFVFRKTGGRSPSREASLDKAFLIKTGFIN